MESKLKEFEGFIKKLALYYGKKFCMPWEDLYQEGCLALIIAERKYRNLKPGELNLVLKKIINRRMYDLVEAEVRKRHFEKPFEEQNEAD